MPRLLGRHDGAAGHVYRREWAALREAYDLNPPLARLLAGRVCVAAVNLSASTAALVDARRALARESGRRPSGRDLERLARRQGLAEGSYHQALDRLRALVERDRAFGYAARVGASPLAALRQPGPEAPT
jgi:hypothetical protein